MDLSSFSSHADFLDRLRQYVTILALRNDLILAKRFSHIISSWMINRMHKLNTLTLKQYMNDTFMRFDFVALAEKDKLLSRFTKLKILLKKNSSLEKKIMS